MDAVADRAMLDEQVSYLRARLRAAAGAGDEAALMTELAHTLGLRSDCRQAAGDAPGALADLNEVIECARAAVRLTNGDREAGGHGDPETAADAQEVLGYALGCRFWMAEEAVDPEDAPGIALVREDRDEAIAVLAALLRWLPPGRPDRPDRPDRPEAALIAGRLSYDRYTDPWPGAGPPDPDDLDAACDLLTQGAAGEEDETDELTTLYLAHALRDRLDLRGGEADRDAFITWGERVLGFSGGADAGWLELRDRLGTERLDRADPAGDPDPGPAGGTGPGPAASRLADLDAGIGHLDAVLAASGPGEPGRVFLLAMLARACWLRADGDYSRYAEIDRMTSYARQAWAANEAQADDQEKLSPRDREMTGLYLCTGLHERLRRPGVPYEPDSVDLIIGVLTEIEPQLADDAGLHLLVEAMLGQCLAARGQSTGRAADLAAARPWLLHAAGQVSAGPSAPGCAPWPSPARWPATSTRPSSFSVRRPGGPTTTRSGPP